MTLQTWCWDWMPKSVKTFCTCFTQYSWTSLRLGRSKSTKYTKVKKEIIVSLPLVLIITHKLSIIIFLYWCQCKWNCKSLESSEEKVFLKQNLKIMSELCIFGLAIRGAYLSGNQYFSSLRGMLWSEKKRYILLANLLFCTG